MYKKHIPQKICFNTIVLETSYDFIARNIKMILCITVSTLDIICDSSRHWWLMYYVFSSHLCQTPACALTFYLQRLCVTDNQENNAVSGRQQCVYCPWWCEHPHELAPLHLVRMYQHSGLVFKYSNGGSPVPIVYVFWKTIMIFQLPFELKTTIFPSKTSAAQNWDLVCVPKLHTLSFCYS